MLPLSHVQVLLIRFGAPIPAGIKTGPGLFIDECPGIRAAARHCRQSIDGYWMISVRIVMITEPWPSVRLRQSAPPWRQLIMSQGATKGRLQFLIFLPPGEPH